MSDFEIVFLTVVVSSKKAKHFLSNIEIYFKSKVEDIQN